MAAETVLSIGIEVDMTFLCALEDDTRKEWVDKHVISGSVPCNRPRQPPLSHMSVLRQDHGSNKVGIICRSEAIILLIVSCHVPCVVD
jgi:hypothetical protein